MSDNHWTEQLSTYDPKWEARFDRAIKDANCLQQSPYPDSAVEIAQRRERAAILTQEWKDAFHAQFETAKDYAEWCRHNLELAADEQGKFLVLPDLPETSAVPEIREWEMAGYRMLSDQNFRCLPVGQPSGITGFARDIPLGGERVTFQLNYDMDGFQSETRCTIEHTNDGNALVCFHHVPDSSGVTPTNAVEFLATGVRQDYFPQYDPEKLKFFIHVPAAAGGSFMGEGFTSVRLTWTGESYAKPLWEHHTMVPAAIREAETSPYQAGPMPAVTSPAPESRRGGNMGRPALTRFSQE